MECISKSEIKFQVDKYRDLRAQAIKYNMKGN